MTRCGLQDRRMPAALALDMRGVTVVEFAMVAPVLCLVLLGAFDVAHTLYARAVLQGIVQKVARDGTLESGTETNTQVLLDNRVKAQVRALANNASIHIGRRFYRTFSEAAAARAEVFTDTDRNGTCNGGEPYEDANRNSRWDEDGGDEGQGGAKDATIYTVTVTYPRFFPIYNLVGGSNTTRLVASTVLRNQPYGEQSSYGAPVVRNCP